MSGKTTVFETLFFLLSFAIPCCACWYVASFPRSLERKINTRGEPGIFSHVINIGLEFSEQKGNVLHVIQPALRSMLGVYDIRPPIVIYM